MKNLTLENIAKACGGIYVGGEEMKDREVQGIVTDSRKAEPGFLFVPIKGARVEPCAPSRRRTSEKKAFLI